MPSRATPRAAVEPDRAPAHPPAPGRGRRVPPVLARVERNGVVESVHRGHVVQVDVNGAPIRTAGDPDLVVTLRSAVKPFTLLALVEAGGVEAFTLSPAELAIMTGSHSGEDLHVRTLQAIFRRSGVAQSLLGCGAEGMPLDVLTAARLARDGERPGPLRHMCSGQHASFLLLAKLAGWPQADYWRPDHPVSGAIRAVVGRVFGIAPERLVIAIDGCGIDTYGVPLRTVARAFAFLADPGAVGRHDPRSSLVPSMVTIRDAMLTHPEMVGGTRDRLDTALMKALPGRVVCKSGSEALRGIGLVPGPRLAGPATGIATKVEDGDGRERAARAVGVEALRQAGVMDPPSLRALARYHRPSERDPHGRLTAETVADFELAPVGELLGRGA
jgi:L-asparaginase II